MAETALALPQGRRIERMKGAGIDDHLYRSAFARVPPNPAFAIHCRCPIIKLADESECRDGCLIGGCTTRRIVGDGSLEVHIDGNFEKFERVSRCDLECDPAALRPSDDGDALGIDDGKLRQVEQRSPSISYAVQPSEGYSLP